VTEVQTAISPFKDSNFEIVRFVSASLSASLINNNPDTESPVMQQLLQIICPNGKLSSSACAKVVNFTEKENKVKQVCDLSKLKIRPDDGRVYLLVSRKTISSINYIGLIEKLYDHFFGLHTITLASYFEIWMKWREEESSVTEKTIKENRFLWNALLQNSDLAQKQLKSLTVQDYITYFRRITKDRTLTRKRFNDLKSILNGMLYRAVEQGIIDHNCLNDINYRQFAYKAENNDIHPFTEEERIQVINHLGDDFYSLAIKFDFYLILRIGELKGLKWSDIHGDSIYIQRFVNDKNKIIEDIKGHQSQGKRYIPLLPAAKAILEQVRQLNPNSEYIFIRNGQPLATVTFNRRLKKCCEELGIEYRSSHKIRFTTASIMYANGAQETELSQLLGHTTLNMTRHYLRNLNPSEQTASKMNECLG
jgi:integrase